MYLCTLLTLVILLSIYFIYRRKNNSLTIGNYILLLYGLSVSLTFLNNNQDIIFSIEATFFFNLILLLFLIPIIKYKGDTFINLSPKQIILFNKISYFFIWTGIATILFFLQAVIRVFTSDVSLLVLRTNMVGGERYVNTGFLLNIFNLISQFYPIILIFYFYSITFLKKSKRFNTLLLISSTSYIFNVLSAVGRDGFILWLMSYLFAFLIFKNYMIRNVYRKQIKIFFYFFTIALVFLIPITVSRFFYQGKKAGIESLVNYSGSQFANFNNIFNRVPNPEKHGSLYNLFPILNLNKNNNEDFLTEWENRVWVLGIDPNIFSTFIGSIYLEIGKLGTFIFAVCFSIIGNFISRASKTTSFSRILLLTLFSQIVLHGLFYYKLAYTVSNIYMISVVILSILFRVKKGDGIINRM